MNNKWMFVCGYIFVVLGFRNTHCVVEDQNYWRDAGISELRRTLERVRGEPGVPRVARNVIVFIGDGMGPTTVTAARLYGPGSGHHLAFEHFPNIGMLKTYSANKLVSDSCSSATALFGGVKANHKTVGVDATVAADDCAAAERVGARVRTFVDWAQDAGLATGFVTTTRVTHATPGPLYAHSPNRKWECEDTIPKEARSKCKDIARQLVEDAPGKYLNVIMGGGRQCLVSQVPDSAADPVDTWSCYSKDCRNLICDWKNDKLKRNASFQVLENNEDLEQLNLLAEYTLGIFANGHLKLDYARDRGPKGMPSLANMTKQAIRLLSKHERGFLLMVEGGMIDQAHHRGHARQALDEVLALSEAVQVAVDSTDSSDTLLVVTADHAHSMLITGYPDRDQGVLSYTKSALDHTNFTNLVYGTGGPNNYQFESGPNGTVRRKEPSLEDTTSFEYSQQALILNDEVTHAGTDVAVYALGPCSELFHSLHENTHVAYVVAYALRMGPFQTNGQASISATFYLSTLTIIFLVWSQC